MRCTFRIIYDTPAHRVLGIWVNGGKAGELTVRVEEYNDFISMLSLAGFRLTGISDEDPG